MKRVKVILKALPTYLVAASTVVTILSEEIVDLLPHSIQGDFTQGVIVVVGALSAAIAIIRRVEPVLPERVGLLDAPVGHGE